METSKDPPIMGMSEGYNGCPYLGTYEDPSTRYGYANSGNCCHRASFPLPVASDHQDAYCLNHNYTRCSIYKVNPNDANALIKLSVNPPWKRELLPPRPVRRGSRSWFSSSPFGFKLVFTILVLVGIAALVVGLSAMYLNSEQQKIAILQATQTREYELFAGVVEETRTAAQMLQATATAYEGSKLAEAANATATAAAIPTATEIPAPTPTSAPTGTPVVVVVPIPTQTAVPNCTSATGYSAELVSGPDLSPPAGLVYQPTEAPPLAEAAWTLRNTSGCSWNQIILRTSQRGRRIAPLYRVDGKDFFSSQTGEALAAPGSQITVVLQFYAEEARSIQAEWLLEINGITLADAPHLVLDVANWITIKTSEDGAPIASPPSEPGEPAQPAPATATPPATRP